MPHTETVDTDLTLRLVQADQSLLSLTFTAPPAVAIRMHDAKIMYSNTKAVQKYHRWHIGALACLDVNDLYPAMRFARWVDDSDYKDFVVDQALPWMHTQSVGLLDELFNLFEEVARDETSNTRLLPFLALLLKGGEDDIHRVECFDGHPAHRTMCLAWKFNQSHDACAVLYAELNDGDYCSAFHGHGEDATCYRGKVIQAFPEALSHQVAGFANPDGSCDGSWSRGKSKYGQEDDGNGPEEYDMLDENDTKSERPF